MADYLARLTIEELWTECRRVKLKVVGDEDVPTLRNMIRSQANTGERTRSFNPRADMKRNKRRVMPQDELTKKAKALRETDRQKARKRKRIAQSDKVITLIEEIFDGKATVTFKNEGGDTQGFEFLEVPRLTQYQTLHQTDEMIMTAARDYVIRNKLM